MNVDLLYPSTRVLILLSNSILSSPRGKQTESPSPPFHSPPRTAFNMPLLPAGGQPRQWPCQHRPTRMRNSTIKGHNCSPYGGDGGGERGAPWGAWGQGALAPERQFHGLDPNVPPAGADEREHQGKLETATS